ncbi:2-phospho-L-lactate guanylyltransferase [Conexibacter sp. DBS9H8]|uniref:2-phospho-L-lactate guanylyltransferase n=1 Tax=Conexibacter sp. DBS9H8 TaxID=2937801 RepID=UPI00200D9815|nr:2-phospho-L-lactate guanylyltransferase [Conexibacter sp. DBS9H8]
MTTTAVLPIKSFSANAKTRLADELALGPRRALVEAMFTDVLTALRRTAAIDRIVVVSADHGAQRIAGGHGAAIVEDAAVGHSNAASAGIADALTHGADRVLIVPGDCPLLDPGELTELLGLDVPGRTALVIPDRHGSGTNGLLLTPPDALTPAFGEDSAARHHQLAVAQGSEPHTVSVRSLALDIDTPEDLALLTETLAATRGGAAHTRGMLNQLARSRG